MHLAPLLHVLMLTCVARLMLHQRMVADIERSNWFLGRLVLRARLSWSCKRGELSSLLILLRILQFLKPHNACCLVIAKLRKLVDGGCAVWLLEAQIGCIVRWQRIPTDVLYRQLMASI